MTPLEETILAYYLATAANDLDIAGRFFPHSQLILFVEDKMQIGTRKFGPKIGRSAKAPATVFIDRMIAEGAFTTVNNEWGGTMHQFVGDIYKKSLKAWQDSDAIVARSRTAGTDFWQNEFAELTA